MEIAMQKLPKLRANHLLDPMRSGPEEIGKPARPQKASGDDRLHEVRERPAPKTWNNLTGSFTDD